MELIKAQKLLDCLAIGISSFCIIHCLVTPVLLISIPVLASTLVADETFHKILLVFVLPASSLALLLGCRCHKDWIVLSLGTLGLAQLAFIAFFGHELLGEAGETVATVTGGLVLVASHFRNHRLCRSNRCNV